MMQPAKTRRGKLAKGFLALGLGVMLAGQAVSAAKANSVVEGSLSMSSAVAVIVANGDYRGNVPDVPYAGNDGKAMARFLSEQMGVQPDNLIVLENAGRADMSRLFGDNGREGRLGAMVEPGVSDLIIYYSGHGVPGLQDGQAYLLPVDADPAQPRRQAFALDDLYAQASGLHARSVTIYLDASFTGRSPGGALIDKTPRIPPAVAPFDMPDGVAVLSAAAPEQMAGWDSENRHGLFTEYLMRGLYGAADVWGNGNGDGNVTLNELKTYLDKEMTLAARRDHGRVQSPDISGVTDFVLARFDPANPPLRPLVGAEELAEAVEKEVPLPEDAAPQTATERPALASEPADVDPLPVPESPQVATVAVPDLPEEAREEAPVRAAFDHGPTPEQALWREVSDSQNPEDLKVYLLKYPDGVYADVAKVRFRRLLNGLGNDRAAEWDLRAERREERRLRRLQAQNRRLKERLRAERRDRIDWRPAPPPPPRWKPRYRRDGWEGPPPPRPPRWERRLSRDFAENGPFGR